MTELQKVTNKLEQTTQLLILSRNRFNEATKLIKELEAEITHHKGKWQHHYDVNKMHLQLIKELEKIIVDDHTVIHQVNNTQCHCELCKKWRINDNKLN